jgi:hypothetical protein
MLASLRFLNLKVPDSGVSDGPGGAQVGLVSTWLLIQLGYARLLGHGRSSHERLDLAGTSKPIAVKSGPPPGRRPGVCTLPSPPYY